LTRIIAPSPPPVYDRADESQFRSQVERAINGLRTVGGSVLSALKERLSSEVKRESVTKLELGWGLDLTDEEDKTKVHLRSEAVSPAAADGILTPDYTDVWLNRVVAAGELFIEAPVSPVRDRTVLLRIDVLDDEAVLTWAPEYVWPNGEAPRLAPYVGAVHYVSLWLDSDGTAAGVMPPEFLPEPRE
jgi:hypothetical protein